ncbi:ABC transporter ATP-binding protein [Agromyces sp. ZXT2-6]
MSADRGSSIAPEPGSGGTGTTPAKPKAGAGRTPATAARNSSARAKTGSTAEAGAAAEADDPGNAEPKPTAKRSAPKSAASKSAAAKSAASKSAAAKSAASKGAAARTAASRTAASKGAAAKSRATKVAETERVDATTGPAEPSAGAEPPSTPTENVESAKPAAKAKPAARRPSTRKAAAPSTAKSDATADGEPAPEPTAASKRTAASRAASSTAAAKRGAAAKTTRTPSVSLAQARERAADARTKAAARQRVAAAMTTDTTEAERAPRKSDPTITPDTGEPAATAAPSTGTVPPPPAPVAAPVEAPAEEESTPPAEPEAAAEASSGAPAEPETETETAKAGTETSVEPVPLVEETVTEDAVTEAPIAPTEEQEPAPAEERAGEPTPTTTDDSGRAVGDERGVAVIPVAPRQSAAPRKKRTLRVARPAPAEAPRVLAIEGLVKRYGDTTAVDAISLDVRAGSFYGIVGPNGAGKTTTLSMVTGLLRPDAGAVRINDIDVWKDPRAAKRATGVLPDRLRLFDRLTGSELLYYSGSLRGLDHRTVLDRSADLAAAFGLEDALDRLVADYSAGMTKKIALACAMIHSPRLLVLDEPFESVDPVSAANLTDILERYVAGGGTVLLSSHSMDLIERVCDSAAIIVGGRVLASGTLDEVRQGQTLEDRFVELAGGRKAAEGLEWLHSFSD